MFGTRQGHQIIQYDRDHPIVSEMCCGPLQSSIQSELRVGDIVQVDVKEGAGRRMQGIQDKDMLATVGAPIRLALRSIQTTDMVAGQLGG